MEYCGENKKCGKLLGKGWQMINCELSTHVMCLGIVCSSSYYQEETL